MSSMDDDTYIPDDDMQDEWMAQVFEVAALNARKENTHRQSAKLFAETTPGADMRVQPLKRFDR